MRFVLKRVEVFYFFINDLFRWYKMKDKMILIYFHARILGNDVAFYLMQSPHIIFFHFRSHYPATQTVAARHTQVIDHQNIFILFYLWIQGW